MGRNIFKIRLILWLILALVVGWFLYLAVVPGGKISYNLDFTKATANYFIGKLSPAERVELKDGLALIKGDPVYFSLHPPRRFTHAKVTIKFKNPTDAPNLEIGLLNDKVAWNYELKPLQNKIIDQLALAWPVVQDQAGARLIEREKKYDSVEKFLNNLPPKEEIGLYDYELRTDFKLENYQPQAEEKIINYQICGSYQFFTYLKNEALNYVFAFVDLNQNKDSDPVMIKVYNQTGPIYEKRIDDDGKAEREAAVKINNLPEGAYRLSFVANNDIITKTITSRQSQFAFIDKVWLAAGQEKNLTLFTNSRQVSAQTINPASLGRIKVGEDWLDLKETYKQIFLKTREQPSQIELAKDDIIISGDGVFGLTSETMLDPRLKNINAHADINQERINYVLTNYQTPLDDDGGWFSAGAEFDLIKAYRENGKYQFLISLPGLTAENQDDGAVLVKEIKIELKGTSLWEKLEKYFKSF